MKNYAYLYSVKTAITIVLFIISVGLFGQVKNALIIDSDAGTDDLRAIALLSAVRDYDLKAITLSDGTLFPDKGAVRVMHLLQCLKLNFVDVGTGEKTIYNKPVWRAFAETVPWGSCDTATHHLSEYPNAATVISTILDNAPSASVTFICLGSLHNLYKTLITNPASISKIKQIIWYNSTNTKQGTNYMFDYKAADYVLNQHVPIKIISTLPGKNIIYSPTFVNEIKKINTPMAHEINYQLNFLISHTDTSHLLFCDELVAVYLASPDLFTMKDDIKQPYIQYVQNYDAEAVRKVYLKLAAGKFFPSHEIVFSEFPLDSMYYQEDVLAVKDKILSRYGKDEFKNAVLTSEIHGHLGIYSIIGVKMGIYALSLLNASKYSVKIISNCGNYPPLSCINDGLIVSTGSSPAYNLFSIDTTQTKPSATFYYQHRCLKISLQDSIYQRIDKILTQAVATFTLSSSAYWNYVRKLAIMEWLSLDRTKIFTIDEIKQ